jgi:Alpha amylase, catalytic domain
MRAHPHLYEINTWPWLEARSRRRGRRLTLGDVADEEWDRLRTLGIDLVYLMGIFRRSAISRQVARSDPALFEAYDRANPGWRARDVVGSAYSIAGYEPDARIGGWNDIDAVRTKLHSRGIGLIVDFVPNHTAFDHPWISEEPDRFVNGTDQAFRRSPAAFRPIELPNGDVRFIACGRDPYFPPWTDVAQLNYFNADTRAAAITELLNLAQHADGVRCDMAMLVLSEVFARTWGELAIGAPPSAEFWADATAAVPGLLFLAEAYWDLESRLQQLGFDFTYDKRLYDRLRGGSADEVRGHLHASPEYQRQSARFIENHDEPRSLTAFGPRAQVAAVVMSTLPGMRFYYDGQFEARRVQAPVQLGVVADEPAGDAVIVESYRRLLDIVDAPVFHEGEWRLCEITGGDGGSPELIAWRWRAGGELRLVVVCLGSQTADGHVDVESELPPGDRFLFEDLLDGGQHSPSTISRAHLASGGLYVRLDPGRAHIFSIVASP